MLSIKVLDDSERLEISETSVVIGDKALPMPPPARRIRPFAVTRVVPPVSPARMDPPAFKAIEPVVARVPCSVMLEPTSKILLPEVKLIWLEACKDTSLAASTSRSPPFERIALVAERVTEPPERSVPEPPLYSNVPSQF